MLKRLRLRDSVGNIHTSLLPQELITGTGADPKPRLRVDVGQTSFFEGREFRSFKEWAAATTATYVIRATVPVNTILFELGIEIEEGAARIETVVGGTPGGSFSEVLPIFGANNMSDRPTPFYVAQNVIEAGGTHTGGTVLDVLRAKTSGNSNFAGSVGSSTGAERGVAIGTYYFRITLTGAIGILKMRWEERVSASSEIINY